MKALFRFTLVLLLVIVCLGFYQGWFHLSTNRTDQKSSATITVDQDKIRADEGKAKVEMQALGKKMSGKTGDRTTTATE
jgi:hypothetical protein